MNSDLLEFCLRGGKMILLTSTEWAKNDYKSLMHSFENGDLTKDFFYRELELLLEDERLSDPTRMLVALVQTGKLEIHIGVVRGSIYHEKKGYFSDDENIVAFDGSGNETFSALSPEDEGNSESFNISWSWDVNDWKKRGSVWKEDLDETLKGSDFPVQRIQDVDPDFIGKWDIDLDLNGYEQAARKRNQRLVKKWDDVFGAKANVANMLDDSDSFVPPFVIPDELRDHQKLGLKSWRKEQCKGVLKHATGSGKTVTAIAAIKSQVESGKNAIVLVPGKELLYQWKEEILSFLPDIQIGLMGDGNDGKKLLDHMRLENDGKGIVLISIINSFREPNVLFKLKKAEKKRGVLLVVDECHKIGSDSYSDLCKLKIKNTLGLSATPERQNDPIGTARLFAFLGKIVDTYSLDQALIDGHLSRYEYEIRRGHLSVNEQNEYNDLSEKIRKQIAYKKKNEPMSDYLKHLLLSARNIVKSAEEKVPIAAEIVSSEYKHAQHWLIYCSDSNMMRILKLQIMSLLPEVDPVLYWSGQSRFDRKNILRKFKKDGGIMLAIKCLDEGVDIPAISHGIIISSSKTEREWIQRRGRLLRKSDLKTKSVIYDILCLPENKTDENRFLLDEIYRAREFCKNADNNILTSYLLQSIAEEYSCVEPEYGGEEE
jgi:superfamily II DNA or RNA helicase